MGGPEDEAQATLGEYLAEGVHAPMYMVRQGRWKFIACETDPDQLFDLAADPHENRNLAGEPEHAERVAESQAMLAARFDVAAIKADVVASQKSRLTLFRALTEGARLSLGFPTPARRLRAVHAQPPGCDRDRHPVALSRPRRKRARSRGASRAAAPAVSTSIPAHQRRLPHRQTPWRARL